MTDTNNANNNNNSNNNEIPIILNESLKKKNIIQKFVKNIKHKHKFITLELNHKYPKQTIILDINNNVNWNKLHADLDKEFNRINIKDQDDKEAIHDTIDDNLDLIIANNNIYDNSIEEKEEKKEKAKEKREISIYKYSQLGKGQLHEAVIVNDLPFFTRYDNITNTSELIEKIEENSRILRPPQREEYPYIPYEFSSNEELAFFIQKAKQITKDELFEISKNIFSTFVDQDKHIIVLLAADSIWTYFQDLNPVTHYAEGVGTNDVGKSSIGYTFEYTGYRVIKGTAISGANYYRVLGNIEPGQCAIIEDEGDNISEDLEKVKILKTGYEYNSRIPKINMNSYNQGQQWFFAYCYKMILAEKSLKEYKVPGLVDRTFSFSCRPGKVKYSIKEVVSQSINKNSRLQKLYDQLLSFRKLMLCYRLIHYKDQLIEIETALKNRDSELCKPLLQLFYGTKALEEIKDTLEEFIKKRRSRKKNSIEAALYPIIKKFVFAEVGLDSEQNTYAELKQKKKIVKVGFYRIWDYIKEGGIEGHYDEQKNKYEYETVEYGSLYLNSLPTFIHNKFTAEVKKQNYGKALLFDIDKLERFEDLYSDGQLQEENVKIEVKEYVSEEIGDNYDNYDSFLGAYANILEKNFNKINIDQGEKVGFDKGIEV